MCLFLLERRLFLILGYYLFIEATDDVRSIDIEVGRVFDLREEGPGVIFAFALDEYAFIDHEFVHFLIPILLNKFTILI